MKNIHEIRKDGYLISTDPQRVNLAAVHRYLSEESYWAKNIPFDIVERSVKHSLCFGIYQEDEQAGFARIISDRATFAWLADVFVLPAHRGKGLSKWLMEVIQAHPDLQGLRRWLLGTLDAHGLYAQFGWNPLTAEQIRRFMQRPGDYHYGELHSPPPTN